MLRSPNLTREQLVLDLRVELFLDGEQEVAAIAFQLKREQVVGQQAPQDLRPPRTDAEAIGIRPRNVPEQRRARLRQACAQGGGDEREVIVLNENGRVGVADFLARPPPQSESLMSRYAAQSSVRNCGRTSTRWHSGQSPSFAKPS